MADDDDIVAMRALTQQLAARLAQVETEVAVLRRERPAPSAGARAVDGIASPPVTIGQATGIAAELLGYPASYNTIRDWCKKFDIGWQMPSGGWLVDRDLLRDHILLRSRRAS